MRILLVVHQFYPEYGSGTERVALGLARMHQRAGHHVRVLGCALGAAGLRGGPSAAIPGAVDRVVDGVPVTMLDRSRLPGAADTSFEIDAGLVQAIEAWLRAERFDVVHLLHSMRMASAVAAVQRAGVPLVTTLTDFFLPCLRINLTDLDDRPCDGPDGGRECARRCLMPPWTEAALQARHRQARTLLEASSARLAPSGWVARRFEAAFPGLGFKVLPHGVDVLALARGGAVQREGDAPVFGFIGSIVPAKGLHVLLEALAAAPQLRLVLRVIGGHHGDSVYRARIEALAAADRRVQMIGPCDADEVARQIGGLDLLCLPSQVPESFSLVLHECAARGVPCLASDLGAPSEAIVRDGSGAVVPAGDLAAWTDAIRQAASDTSLRQRWRRSIRPVTRIEEEAFLYESVYREVTRT